MKTIYSIEKIVVCLVTSITHDKHTLNTCTLNNVTAVCLYITAVCLSILRLSVLILRLSVFILRLSVSLYYETENIRNKKAVYGKEIIHNY